MSEPIQMDAKEDWREELLDTRGPWPVKRYAIFQAREGGPDALMCVGDYWLPLIFSRREAAEEYLSERRSSEAEYIGTIWITPDSPEPDDREGLVEALDWAIEQAEDRGEFLDTDPDFDASRLFDRADALRALRDRLQAQEAGDGE